MLMDMEELLGRISNRAMVGYMREASTCYAAGAYRGCIVLSYIALFDDLRAKLDHLAKVSKTAQKVHKEVEKRAGDRRTDRAARRIQLLPDDADRRYHRNHAIGTRGHASGSLWIVARAAG